MIRGTTAPFKFKLPFKGSEIDILEVTFWQPGNNGTIEEPLPIVKPKTSCVIDNEGYEQGVILDQRETLRFSDKHKAFWQIRAKAIDAIGGTVVGTKEIPIDVYPMFRDNALESNILPTPDYNDMIILDGYKVGG